MVELDSHPNEFKCFFFDNPYFSEQECILFIIKYSVLMQKIKNHYDSVYLSNILHIVSKEDDRSLKNIHYC